MAGFDYGKISGGFLSGLEAGQRFRANRQLEKQRDQALELGEYRLEAARDFRRERDPDTTKVLGELDPSTVQDYQGLEDPFAIRLFDFFSKRRKKQRAAARQPVALPQLGQEYGPSSVYAGPSASTIEFPADDFGGTISLPEFADGGELSPEVVARLRKTLETTVAEDQAQDPQGRKAADLDQLSAQLAYSRAQPSYEYLERTEGKGPPRQPDVLARISRSAGEFFDPDSASNVARRKRNAAGEDSTSRYLFGDPVTAETREPVVPSRGMVPTRAGARPSALPLDPAGAQSPALAANSAAPRQAVAGQQAAPSPNLVDFSELDVEPSEVPNMQLDDWRKYRARMVDAARKSGQPGLVDEVNDMVTGMQQKGFVNYGQQGLALQQAGNAKGAMAAYRAAFQYFPNGNDVEFGIMKDKKTGRPQIIGFGKDEKTGKVIPGSELVMDPERVAVMLENFQKPGAFRMWTKDWREEKTQERRYQEVTKPVAQAQVTALANNSEANILRAENSALRAGAPGGPSAAVLATDARNAGRVFREANAEIALQDPQQAQYLTAIMAQVKARNPQVPDDRIVYEIQKAQREGTLPQILQRLGIQ